MRQMDVDSAFLIPPLLEHEIVYSYPPKGFELMCELFDLEDSVAENKFSCSAQVSEMCLRPEELKLQVEQTPGGYFETP